MPSQPQLYPADLIENSTESFLSEISARSQVIYSTVVLAVIAALVALPFVRVDVSVQSPGVVRPVGEKNELRPLVAGTVAEVRVRDNQTVVAGQTLLVIRSEVTDVQLRLNGQQQAQKRAFVADLERLVRLSSVTSFEAMGLQSSLYAQQYAQFRAQMDESREQQRKSIKHLGIDRQLYRDQVIAMREMDDKEAAHRQLLDQYRSATERQLSLWQADLNTHRVALTELMAQEKQLRQEEARHTIRSPVAGTLQQWTGKYPGSAVQAGEVLGVVSPDADLVVECLVSPGDIGQVRVGQRGIFQVDTYDYNQWGTVGGRVMEVSNDILMADNRPVFRVRCRLDRTFLTIKSGYRGQLKKGMTLRARFLLTQRSLYQLLYDQADDWLNPLNG